MYFKIQFFIFCSSHQRVKSFYFLFFTFMLKYNLQKRLTNKHIFNVEYHQISLLQNLPLFFYLMYWPDNLCLVLFFFVFSTLRFSQYNLWPSPSAVSRIHQYLSLFDFFFAAELTTDSSRKKIKCYKIRYALKENLKSNWPKFQEKKPES